MRNASGVTALVALGNTQRYISQLRAPLLLVARTRDVVAQIAHLDTAWDACERIIDMLRARIEPLLLAAAMAFHPRLGRASPLGGMDCALFRDVVRDALLDRFIM